MSNRQWNENIMSGVRLFLGEDVVSRLTTGRGVAMAQLRELAQLGGMRWRLAPCGNTTQPTVVMELLHTRLRVHVYGPRANRAGGYLGRTITSVGVLQNFAADDALVLVDPRLPLGNRLLGLSDPLDAHPRVQTALGGSAIQRGNARDVAEVLFWSMEALRDEAA